MDHAFVVQWAQQNLRQHFIGLASRLPGATERDEGAYTFIDTGLPSDSLNVVYGARRHGLTSANAAAVMAHFTDKSLPFAWWLGPADLWAGDLLAEMGLRLAGNHAGLSGQPDALALDDADLPDGELRRVSRPADVSLHAQLLAANWSPPDDALVECYTRAAEQLVQPGSDRILFLWHAGGEPVATAELCVSAHVTGLYSVATRPDARSRGHDAAVVVAALRHARDVAGAETIVTLATPQARPLFLRLGLRSFGEFHEFLPELREREWAG